MPQQLNLDGCAAQNGAFPIPMDDARAMAPEGFAPVALDPQGLTGLVFAMAFTC